MREECSHGVRGIAFVGYRSRLQYVKSRLVEDPEEEQLERDKERIARGFRRFARKNHWLIEPFNPIPKHQTKEEE